MFNELLNRITSRARKHGLNPVLCAGSKYAAKYLVLVLFASLAIGGRAQSTSSGDFRGSVTDQTGALVPGVTVMVLNVDTGISKNYYTNQDGLYDTSSIPPGHYMFTFKKEGFEQFVRGPITLEVGVTGVDAQLQVGSASQVVTVTADAALLTTESSDQTATLESQTMAQLPQVGADWENFMILLPGASGAASAPQGSSNPGPIAAVNGNLPYTNELSDGSSITLPGSMNADPGIFETIAEVQVSESSFSAQYGIGGVVINQITKGGTDRFHGSAYEYFQNDALDAAEYGFGNQVQVPVLRYNNFGGSIGGPILKKKMFFYFDYDHTINHGGASNSYSTVPTSNVMSGNLTGMPTIYDPLTQTIGIDSAGNHYPIRQSFQSEYGLSYNGIPSAVIDKVAAAIQQYFPTPSDHIAGGKFVPGNLDTLGVLENNFFSSLPNESRTIRYFGKLDYDLTPNNRLSLSDLDSDYPLVSPSSMTACPVGCQNSDGEDTYSQISDVWNISNRTINEARLGFTEELNFFVDPTVGAGYPSKLDWQFAKSDAFPTSYYGGYTSIAPASNSIQKQGFFDYSDVVTMIRGKHVLHFGGELLAYRYNATAWGNTNAGTFSYSGAYTGDWVVDPATGVASPEVGTGLPYADFLLGVANAWDASYSPEFGGRLKTPQMFVQDDYKLRPNLTLNLGLRYQISHGFNEVHGNEASFDPTVINPATGTLGAFWYGTTHANGRTSVEANTFDTFLPRVGFSWLAKPNTTLRAGFGLYAYNWSMDSTTGNAIGSAFSPSGSVQDETNGVTPVTKLDGAGTYFGTGTHLPYVPLTTDPAAYNGQGVWYTEYHAPVTKNEEWNVSIQRQFSPELAAQVSYVGAHAVHLPFSTDINQVPESELSPNDSQYRAYPQYQSIAGNRNDAISNYDALQALITKRMRSGITFNFNYVWSHFLVDQDSAGWGGRGGTANFQNGLVSAANYSNSNFDVRQAFKGYAIYQLPFGRGQRFLNNNAITDALVGGWQLSGDVILSTGNPFDVLSSQATYALSGVAYPNWSGVSALKGYRTIQAWYNPAAFLLPANGTFGAVKRNSIYGPGIDKIDLTGGKTFSLPWENVKIQIRADAVNAFNHPSFGIPQQQLSNAPQVGAPFPASNFSGITSTTVGGRTVQLAAHLTF